MMDELQSPGSNKKKRKTADSLPGQKRRLAKKSKIAGDFAGACGQSPSRSSFNSPATPSNQTVRIPSGKNAKTGPRTKPNTTPQSRDLSIPTRVSSRVSRPTFKKKASFFLRQSHSPESDGTPPLGIIPYPSLKPKKPTSSPTQRLAGNNIPSKSKWHDPNPIELTSSDDGSRHQPPSKRVKKKLFGSQVIDLCSEGEDVIASPSHTRTRDEASVVVVLSTDEEVDLKTSTLSHLAFRETDTRESPALPPLRDISSAIEVESVFQASSLSQAHDTPVPKFKASVAEDVADKNMYAEKVNLPRGSLQALYNEALACCAREPQRAKDIADQPSPFSSPKCKSPARTIRYAAKTQWPRLHTPLFFDRISLRLKARLRQLKTSDVKNFPDPTAFLEPKVVSDDTSLNSMQTPKVNEEEEDTLTYSDTFMDISTVEVAPKITLAPPVDFQCDALSDTQAARITSQSPSHSANHVPAEVTVFEETSVLNSIQLSTNCISATSGGANFSAISTNKLCNTPSNPSNSDTINDQIETPQQAEASFFGRESCADQVATIEPIILRDAQFFVKALQRKYEASKISGFSLYPALNLNDTAKPSAAFEPLSEPLSESFPESPTEYTTITDTSSAIISSNLLTSSISEYSFQSSMVSPDPVMTRCISVHTILSTEDVSESSKAPTILLAEQGTTLDLSSPPGLSSNVSSGFQCLSKSPAVLNLFPLSSSSTADTLSSRNPSPSTQSRQSLDSSTSVESANCHLLTPDDSPSPLIKSQKQEPLISSNSFPSSVDVPLFDIDMSELNLQTLMGSKFDEDDDDDDISISGMELTYPEELRTT